MLKNPVEEKVNEWAKTNAEFREINQKIIHLEKRLFADYKAGAPPNPNFFLRLKKWLENVPLDIDQQTLFQLIPELFYVSELEFNSLYRSAYNIEVAKWIIDKIDLKFNTANPEESLKNAVENTWFCSATDSFRINDFFKINGIPSKYDLRPDWHSLTQLGDKKSILDYIKNKKIPRVVLLEDFVGSGSQVKSRIEFICDNFPDLDVLFISLITCPQGIATLNALEFSYPKLKIKHLIKLPKDSFIAEVTFPSEKSIHQNTREMAIRLYPITADGKISPAEKPYNALGYQKTGALIVLYTNTPDNTLPIIHWESAKWVPLFKRITRL